MKNIASQYNMLTKHNPLHFVSLKQVSTFPRASEAERNFFSSAPAKRSASPPPRASAQISPTPPEPTTLSPAQAKPSAISSPPHQRSAVQPSFPECKRSSSRNFFSRTENRLRNEQDKEWKPKLY